MSTYCARQPKHSYRDEAYATPVSEEGRLDVESSSHLTCIAHMRNSALLVPSVPRRVKDGTNVIYTLYLQYYCVPPVESTAEFQGEFVPSCHRRQRGQPSFSYGFAWLPACLPPSTCDYPYRVRRERARLLSTQFLLAGTANVLLLPPIHRCYLPQWRE